MDQLARELQIIDSVQGAVVSADLEGVVQSWNLGAERLYGYGAIEAVGQDIGFLDVTGAAPTMAEVLQELQDTGRQEFEVQNRTKDGEDIWVDLRLSLLRDQTGRAVGVVGCSHDISERRRVEQATRRRLQQQAAVAELSRHALIGGALPLLMHTACACIAEMLDAEYAKVLELEPGGDRFLLRAGVGWKAGRIGEARIDADRRSQAGFTLDSDEPVVVEDLGEEDRFEAPPLLREHGVVSGISVVIQGGKRPFGVLGVHATRPRRFSADDVHVVRTVANILAAAIRRERSEQTMRKSEQQLRRMVEALPHGAVHIADGEVWVNKAVEEITGYQRSELRTLDEWFARVHGEHKDEFRAVYDEERRLGLPRKKTVPIVRKDGREKLIEVAGYLSERDEVWILDDVSERSELRTRLAHTERLAAVGELAAGVAHEVNNPVNTMINCAQLIKDGDRDPALLDDIISEGERIAGIVRELLRFSRDGHDEPEPVDCRQVLERTLTLIGESIRKQGIELRVELDSVPTTVLGHPQKLQQVFLNLLLNAKDAIREQADRAGSEILIRATETELGGRPALEISVRDNGPGIPPDRLRQVFEPFFTTKSAQGGTGLGLPISRNIVEKHGGTLHVVSEPGSFTEFSIVLPAEEWR